MPRYGYRRRGYALSAYARAKRSIQRTERARQQRIIAANLLGIGPQGSQNSIAAFGADYASATPQQRAARRVFGFKGKGGYGPVLAAAANALGPLAVKYAKSKGGLVGAIGSGVGKMFGWGAYQAPTGDVVATNQLVETGGAVAMPDQQGISVNADDHTGDVVIAHTEFIQNITAEVPAGSTSSTFKNVVFPINPGLSTTFPFLSQLAQNFTMYKFEGLMFQYKPQTGESGQTSNSLGKVIMACDYDATSEPYVNSVQMNNADYAQSTKPSVGAAHGIETDPQQLSMKMMYVRNGATTRDKAFTDLGLFQVATEGIPFTSSAAAQTQTLGELWVTYKVRLSRASLYGALLGQNIAQDHLATQYQYPSAWSQQTWVKNTNSIGLSLVRSSWTTPATIWQTGTAGGVTAPKLTVNFPVNISLGAYRMLIRCVGSITLSSNPYVVNSANIKFFKPGTQATGPDAGVLPVAQNGTDTVAGSGTPVPTMGNHFLCFPKADAGTSLENACVVFFQVEAPGNNIASITFSVDGPAVVAGTSVDWIIDVSQVNAISALSYTSTANYQW